MDEAAAAAIPSPSELLFLAKQTVRPAAAHLKFNK